MCVNVVFSGGGIKGLVYLGVIKYLEEEGIKIYAAGGSSVGALFASLLIAGYTYQELLYLVDDFDINILYNKDKSNFNVFKNKGIFSIASLENYIYDLLKQKNIFYFGDLKNEGKYLLKIITTDVTAMKMVIIPDDLFNYGINPDEFLVSKAVAMSCSIPLLYMPYKLNNNYFIDGGVSDNFPLWLFSSDNDYYTYGFNIVKEKPGKLKAKYTKAILWLKNKIISQNTLKDISNASEISIVVSNINLIDFKKGLYKKRDFICMGYKSAKEKLKQIL